MTSSFSHTLDGPSASLGEGLRALAESPVYGQLPPALRFVAELIFDELASNALKYGGPGRRSIVFQLDFDGEAMRVVLADDGQPFDPWQRAGVAERDAATAIEDLAIGGRGIHMLKQATDTQHYERREGRNINTLIRSIHSLSPQPVS